MRTDTREVPTSSRKVVISITLVGVILLVAFWLRWRYAQTISLYVDEFTTLWAARRVQTLGLPIMPSGVLYTRGLLATYVEAAFLSLFGFSYLIGRLPGVLFGVATVAALWLAGRRIWREEVGLLAALGLALLPEAILWGGRARFYTQLQFFTLLTVWAAFAAIADPTATAKQQARRQWLFTLCFILALFSHEETVLLYPPLLLGMLWWRGWRFFLQRSVVLTQAFCLVALAVRYAIEILGQPGYFETIQAQRPYVGMIFDLVGAWRTYSPLFLATDRLLWTLGALVAFGVALYVLAQNQWRPNRLPLSHQATLFFVLQLLFVLAVVFTLVGTSWREGRYLFFVQPLWLLVGAGGIGFLLGQPRLALWVQRGALVVITALLLFLQWPSAQAVLQQQVEGYDLALAWLAQNRQPGDVVLSPQPPACALVLGPCDYYAVQRGYEEFVIKRDGVLVDRWSGAKLLASTTALTTVLQQAPRTWFVTDSFRLATRYETDFVHTVIDQFDLAYEAQGVMVLRADGWRTFPPTMMKPRPTPAQFGPLTLVGDAWPRVADRPEQRVTLFWQATAPISEQINTSLRLVRSDGAVLSRSDGPPARGLIPTTLFFDMPLPDTKTITVPTDLPDGIYRLEALAYHAATVTPLADPVPVAWWQKGESTPPAQRLDAAWQDGIILVGADAISTTVAAGTTLPVRLVWSATTQPKRDYTIFVHLVDESGVPLAQNDRQPLGGFYPTSAWEPGAQVAETYQLDIPADLAPGRYRVVTGLYDPVKNERLLGADSSTSFLLTIITVGL
jgi:4-amino-4-deoxy-L-arabinose transferase-like glycosyltransferase